MAEQMLLLCADIYDAASDVVRAAGGIKKVGPEMYPTKDAEAARGRLKDCLNRNRREDFGPDELLWLLKKGREIGCHSLMHFLADDTLYGRPAPIEPLDEFAQLQRAYIDSVKQQQILVARMESLATISTTTKRA